MSYIHRLRCWVLSLALFTQQGLLNYAYANGSGATLDQKRIGLMGILHNMFAHSNIRPVTPAALDDVIGKAEELKQGYGTSPAARVIEEQVLTPLRSAKSVLEQFAACSNPHVLGALSSSLFSRPNCQIDTEEQLQNYSFAGLASLAQNISEIIQRSRAGVGSLNDSEKTNLKNLLYGKVRSSVVAPYWQVKNKYFGEVPPARGGITNPLLNAFSELSEIPYNPEVDGAVRRTPWISELIGMSARSEEEVATNLEELRGETTQLLIDTARYNSLSTQGYEATMNLAEGLRLMRSSEGELVNLIDREHQDAQRRVIAGLGSGVPELFLGRDIARLSHRERRSVEFIRMLTPGEFSNPPRVRINGFQGEEGVSFSTPLGENIPYLPSAAERVLGERRLRVADLAQRAGLRVVDFELPPERLNLPRTDTSAWELVLRDSAEYQGRDVATMANRTSEKIRTRVLYDFERRFERGQRVRVADLERRYALIVPDIEDREGVPLFMSNAELFGRHHGLYVDTRARLNRGDSGCLVRGLPLDEADRLSRFGSVSPNITQEETQAALSNCLKMAEDVMETVDEWYTEEDNDEFIENVLLAYPGVASAAILENPRLAPLLCEYQSNAVRNAENDRQRQAKIDNAMRIGGAIAALALLVATGGLAAAGYAAAGTLISAGIGMGIGFATAGYEFHRAYEENAAANLALAHWVWLGQQAGRSAEEIKALFDQAWDHFKEGLWNGAFAALDALIFFRGLRALRTVAQLEQVAQDGAQISQLLARARTEAQAARAETILGLARAEVTNHERLVAGIRQAVSTGASPSSIGARLLESGLDEARVVEAILGGFDRGDEALRAMRAAGLGRTGASASEMAAVAQALSRNGLYSEQSAVNLMRSLYPEREVAELAGSLREAYRLTPQGLEDARRMRDYLRLQATAHNAGPFAALEGLEALSEADQIRVLNNLADVRAGIPLNNIDEAEELARMMLNSPNPDLIFATVNDGQTIARTGRYWANADATAFGSRLLPQTYIQRLRAGVLGGTHRIVYQGEAARLFRPIENTGFWRGGLKRFLGGQYTATARGSSIASRGDIIIDALRYDEATKTIFITEAHIARAGEIQQALDGTTTAGRFGRWGGDTARSTLMPYLKVGGTSVFIEGATALAVYLMGERALSVVSSQEQE